MGGWLGWLPWVIPAFALLLSAIAVRRDLQWKRAEKLQAVAEIVGIEEREDSEDGTTYAARYRFRSFDGRTVETGDGLYGPVRPLVGRSVKLWYDRARPERVFHDDRGMGVGMYLFLVVFNVLMIAFVAGFTWLAGD